MGPPGRCQRDNVGKHGPHAPFCNTPQPLQLPQQGTAQRRASTVCWTGTTHPGLRGADMIILYKDQKGAWRLEDRFGTDDQCQFADAKPPKDMLQSYSLLRAEDREGVALEWAIRRPLDTCDVLDTRISVTTDPLYCSWAIGDLSPPQHIGVQGWESFPGISHGLVQRGTVDCSFIFRLDVPRSIPAGAISVDVKSSAPYEIKETGWGRGTVGASGSLRKTYFGDNSSSSIMWKHLLILVVFS